MGSPPKHPLKVLDDWKAIKKICLDFVEKKGNLFSLNFDEDYHIKIFEKFDKYNFRFVVSTPYLSQQKTHISVTYIPANQTSNELKQFSIEAESLLPMLNSWSLLVERFYMHHPDNVLLEELTEKYFQDFRNFDEDADTMPFDEQQQKALIFIANQVQDLLRQDENFDEKTQEIINDVEAIKESVPNISKNSTMKMWSKVFAKVQIGKPLYSKILSKILDACIAFGVEKSIPFLIELGIKLFSKH